MDPAEPIIRINLDCNQNCVFCNTTRSADNLLLDRKAILAAISRLAGSRYLTISGREPTLHPALPAFIVHARRAGIDSVCLQTNAVRCAYPEYSRALAEAGLTEAMVSLHSHRAAVSDRLTRAPGTFERTLAGIRALADNGVRMILNFVINTKNYREMAEWVRFVHGDLSFVEEVIFSTVSPVGYAPVHRAVIPRSSDVLPFLREAVALAAAEGLRVDLPDMCGMPLCLLGGLERFADAARHPPVAHLPGGKSKRAECSRCVHEPRCSGVWDGYLALYGWDEFEPVAGAAAPSA